MCEAIHLFQSVDLLAFVVFVDLFPSTSSFFRFQDLTFNQTAPDTKGRFYSIDFFALPLTNVFDSELSVRKCVGKANHRLMGRKEQRTLLFTDIKCVHAPQSVVTHLYSEYLHHLLTNSNRMEKEDEEKFVFFRLLWWCLALFQQLINVWCPLYPDHLILHNS